MAEVEPVPGPTPPPISGWRDVVAEGRGPALILIALGVWLGAADSLVTATVMPSVSRELGGYQWFAWTVAGFLVGSILAAFTAGRLSERFGLKAATAVAGAILAAGCVLSAAAPNIETFLLGRVIQGVGGGWVSGFAFVAVAVIFPDRHLARVFAMATSIWGVATVLGPLIGGLFAEAGLWRWVFWFFAAQALLFAAAGPILMRGRGRSETGGALPWRRIVLIGVGLLLLASAGAGPPLLVAIGMAAAGAATLGAALWLESRSEVRLLPHRAGDLRTVAGAGYAAMFLMMACGIALGIYGPAILQQLAGLSPLAAGYVVGAQALTWTLVALVAAGAKPAAEPLWIRGGATAVALGAVALAITLPTGNAPWVAAAAALSGGGFGAASALMNRRVLGSLGAEDRAVGGSAVNALRQTGGVVGAALAGVVANAVGFGLGVTDATAMATGRWVFVAAAPFGLAAIVAAAALTRRR